MAQGLINQDMTLLCEPRAPNCEERPPRHRPEERAAQVTVPQSLSARRVCRSIPQTVQKGQYLHSADEEDQAQRCLLTQAYDFNHLLHICPTNESVLLRKDGTPPP